MNMKQVSWVLGGIVVVLVAVTVINSSDGLDQLEQHLAEQGWEKSQLNLMVGGYSSSFLSQSAHGKYASSDPTRPGEVTVKVERPTPFHDWSVTTYRHDLGDT
ncbi:hypothetical protein CMO84_05865 [Candidatus Woesearchaeota archaeon]|jgi:hypothetical protein|nr:hypothetical protein [Candidatus Woesearchaeota archaeon]